MRSGRALKAIGGVGIAAVCVAGIVILVIAFAGADDLADNPRHLGRAPEKPLIDEVAGTYAGVGLGDDYPALRASIPSLRDSSEGGFGIPQDLYPPGHWPFDPNRPKKRARVPTSD